jgi:DNA polymerase
MAMEVGIFCGSSPEGCRSQVLATRVLPASGRVTLPGVPPTTAQQRRDDLKRVYDEARACTRCPQLAATRTQVVFGAGNADADLMFVGEAPGRDEDEQGLPFVGRSGKLLNTLLGEIGLAREEVFVINTLKCRPPGNRDPHPSEIDNCQDYLMRQVALVEPVVICTLGNFATKLLRGDPTGITRVHGQAQELTIGTRTVRLYPLFHPAAALYTPANVEVLRADFARIPDLLAQGPPSQPAGAQEPEPAVPEPAVAQEAAADEPGWAARDAPDSQLGLF